MEKTKLVFCDKCKHKKFVEAAMGCCSYMCKSNPKHLHGYLREFTQMDECELKNTNNDCTEFKKRLL